MSHWTKVRKECDSVVCIDVTLARYLHWILQSVLVSAAGPARLFPPRDSHHPTSLSGGRGTEHRRPSLAAEGFFSLRGAPGCGWLHRNEVHRENCSLVLGRCMHVGKGHKKPWPRVPWKQEQPQILNLTIPILLDVQEGLFLVFTHTQKTKNNNLFIH